MSEKIIKNPLTNWVRRSVDESKQRLLFASPFVNSQATKLLDEQNTKHIVDKRLIIRFDETSLTTFNLPVFKNLLDLGFLIQYDEEIHLKLYITDNDAYVTSSNLTSGGFETNKELTVKVDSTNIPSCIGVFNEIWSGCSENKITYELIKENWSKYEIILAREKSKNTVHRTVIKAKKVEEIDFDVVINDIQKNIFFSVRDRDVFEANIKRERVKEELLKCFDPVLFYSPEGHPQRRDNLFYDFVYGCEYRLAGTGLREEQFRDAFEHQDFEKAINFIYPEMLGLKPWNLNDKEELQEFCNGLFNFVIPHYSVVLPIRLASFFYPDFFLPIFNLDHLKQLCEYLGLETLVETKGDKLYVYNTFVADKLKVLPYNNYVKSDVAYLLLYTYELYKRINVGEDYQHILDVCSKKWIKDYFKKGYDILKGLHILK